MSPASGEFGPLTLRLALEAGRMGVWRWDPASGEVRWGPELEHLFGLPERSFGGTFDDFLARVHPDDREAMAAAIHRAVATGEPIAGEHRIVRPDGTVRWVEARGEPVRGADGAVTAWVGVGIDVTERKQAENALAAREAVLSLAVDVARMGVWTWWPDQHRVEWTSSMERLLGLAPGSLRDRRSFLDLVHPDDRAAVEALGRRAPDADEVDTEYRVVAPDGRIRWLERRGRALPTRSGEAPVWVGVSIDVTERKEWEATLDWLLQVERQAHAEAQAARDELTSTVALLDTMLAAAPLGFGFFDLDLRFLRVNDVLAEINGIPAADHVGRRLAEVVPDLAARVEPELRRVIETGDALVDVEEHGQTRAMPGVERHWLASYYPVRGADGQLHGIGALVVEITERTRREQALRMQREIGELLAGPSLEVEDLLDRVARVPVPAFADGCVLFLAPGGPVLRAAAVAHVDPAVEARLRREVAVSPVRVDGRAPSARVVRTGRPVLVERITEEDRTAVAADGSYVRAAAEAVESVVATPVRLGGRTMGALTLLRGVGGRRFVVADLEVAEEVASRVAQLIEARRLQDEADRARARLDLLARLGELATVELDSTARLQRAAELLLPDLADACGVYLVEDGTLRLVAATNRDGPVTPPAEDRAFPLDAPFPATQAVRRGRPVLYAGDVDQSFLEVVPAARAARLRDMGLRSVLAVPLPGPDGPIGAIGLAYTARSDRLYAPTDVPLATELARRIAPIVEHARRFEHERDTAEALQRSFLPRALPEAPGTRVAARYLAGTAGLKVGGDWYDVLRLRDGRLLLVIGDVVGHGVRAAALMGQLRTAVRLLALDESAPGVLLARLNRFLLEHDETEMATCCAVTLDPPTGELRWASAGHPPPAVRGPDGEVSFLRVARGAPLGALDREGYPEEGSRLDAGSLLLLYTDGLVERRAESLDVGFDRLAAALASGPGPAGALCDHVVDALLGDQAPTDDVALLAVATAADADLVLSLAARPGELAPMRAALRRWLRAAGVGEGRAADVVLAVNEIATNAVEHAYGLDPSTFELAVRMDGAAVVATVTDHGRWRQVPRMEGGRGLMLARSLVDELHVETGDAGTTVTLRARTAGEPA